MGAKRTPLIELLERVPRDAVLVVEHDQFSSSSHPVGRLCHEAAAALRAVLAEVEKLRAEVAEWKRVAAAQAELHGEAEERAEQLAEDDAWCAECGSTNCWTIFMNTGRQPRA